MLLDTMQVNEANTMRLFGIWTMFVALTISVVAAYYSIVGLVAIFAASMTAVIVMGAALEIGKITTAIWLHSYWDKASWMIKSYLSIALVLLMFITSMGIFGFLSKAHIEQTAMAGEQTAQLTRVESEIARYKAEIVRSDEKIIKLESADDKADSNIQEQIVAEEERIATKLEQLQIAIDEQNAALEDSIAPYVAQQQSSDAIISQLNLYVETNQIKKLQGIVGEVQDGQYGPKTAAKVEEYRTRLLADRDEALEVINDLRTAARDEITRLRANTETQTTASNALINRLVSELGATAVVDVTEDVDKLNQKIKNAESELDRLYEKKYTIEADTRKLEAEVGPVKYIAALVYGDNASKDTLEDAVRWVIIILVIVFDPLAVVLVIAGITLIENAPKRESKIVVDNENVEETLAALDEYIDDNPDEMVEMDEEYFAQFDDLIEGVDISDDRDISDQLKLNRETREIQQNVNDEAIAHFEDTIDKMKSAGQWPGSKKEVIDADETGRLEQLLELADQETLDEVYKTLKDEEK